MSSKKKTISDEAECPQCNKKETVGFLGGNSTKKYFCNDCCIEFTVKGKKIEAFEITSGGTVQAYKK